MIAVLLLLSSSPAFAAGYSCLSVDQDTQVVIDLEPAQAQAKQVTFIDPELSEDSRVIAHFETEVLATEGTEAGVRYTSQVSPQIEHPGKILGGTRLGLLKEVSVEVQTSSEQSKLRALTEGAMYGAEVKYTKKNGEVLTQDFDCALYLGDRPH